MKNLVYKGDLFNKAPPLNSSSFLPLLFFPFSSTLSLFPSSPTISFILSCLEWNGLWIISIWLYSSLSFLVSLHVLNTLCVWYCSSLLEQLARLQILLPNGSSKTAQKATCILLLLLSFSLLLSPSLQPDPHSHVSQEGDFSKDRERSRSLLAVVDTEISPPPVFSVAGWVEALSTLVGKLRLRPEYADSDPQTNHNHDHNYDYNHSLWPHYRKRNLNHADTELLPNQHHWLPTQSLGYCSTASSNTLDSAN